MADDVKLTDKRRRTKKKKSSLSTLKKKLNIKKRYRSLFHINFINHVNNKSTCYPSVWFK